MPRLPLAVLPERVIPREFQSVTSRICSPPLIDSLYNANLTAGQPRDKCIASAFRIPAGLNLNWAGNYEISSRDQRLDGNK